MLAFPQPPELYVWATLMAMLWTQRVRKERVLSALCYSIIKHNNFIEFFFLSLVFYGKFYEADCYIVLKVCMSILLHCSFGVVFLLPQNHSVFLF